MERSKPGRPKSDKPIRDKSITIKMTEQEYENLKKVCYDERKAYIDILLRGLEDLSDQK